MADDSTQGPQGAEDSTALNDIATNGNLLNQNISALITAVDGLSSIVLPVSKGGTGLDHVNTGDLLYGSATNVYSLLSDVATGNALISGGVGGSPSWGKIGLTTHVSGILPVANGGTNLGTLTAHALLLGAGASSVAFATPSTAGQPLLSNGASSDPSFQPWTDGIGGFFAFPLAQSYKIWLSSPFSGSITSTTTICTAGTCTATFQINGTNIGGAANSVSTTEQTQAHSTGNTFAAGDDILIVLSSISSCQNMSLMIAFTRP